MSSTSDRDEAPPPPSQNDAASSADVSSAESRPTPLAFRAVRGGLWLAGSSYWTLGFGFVANVLLTRLLTPDVYGEFALGMFFFTLFQIRGKLGLNYAFAHHGSVTGESVGTLFAVEVVLGLAGFLLTLIAAPILISLGYASIVVVIAVTMAFLAFIESLQSVFSVVLETRLHFKPTSVIGSVVMPLSYVPAFWLALHDNGSYSLLAQAVTFSVLAQLAGLFYVVFWLRPLFHLQWRYRKQLAISLVRFGGTTGIGNFLSGMFMQLDNFILGTVAGVTTLGYYDRAYRLAQWPALLLNAVVGRAAVFTYSQLRGDAERMQRSSSMMFWISANVATPMALALFLSAADLIPLLYGPQWLPVAPVLRILLIASVMRPIWENASALFVGMGKPRHIIEVSVVQLAVLVLIGAPLAVTAEATGMATGVVLALLISLAIAFFLIGKMLHLELWDLFAGPVIASGLTLVGYWIVVRIVGSAYPLWFSVAWKILYAFVAFAALSALVQPRKFRTRLTYVIRLMRGSTAVELP